MNTADLFQNVLRAMFFGFLVGTVMTLLLMLSSYSIVDTNLRGSILEERIMNYLHDHPGESLLSMDSKTFASALTSYADVGLHPDSIGLRIVVLDPATMKPALALESSDTKYALMYDPSNLIPDWFPATVSDPVHSDLKINYVSSVSYRLYNDPATHKTYLLMFQFISK